MKGAPKEITVAKLQCIVMPNGEVICAGQTIGWVKTLGKFLTPAPIKPKHRPIGWDGKPGGTCDCPECGGEPDAMGEGQAL